LLVHLGKTLCKKIPKCHACPLKGTEHRAKRMASTALSIPRKRASRRVQ
jgi:adenine-specific DNA glycosylase